MNNIKIILLFILVFLTNKYTLAQNVGIGNTDPKAKLDISGDLILKSADLTLAEGNTLALDVNTNKYNHYKLIGPTSNFQIGGIAAGEHDRIITLYNRAGHSLEVYNDDVNADVANRILTGTGGTLAVYPGGSLTLKYDNTINKWEITASHYNSLDNFGSGNWTLSGNDIYNNNVGNVGIGTSTPDASAALEVYSNTTGFLPPRMTESQRNAIATPSEGLLIFCTDCTIKSLYQFINGVWQSLISNNTGNYGTVVNPITGKVWLDRNLGATQVATSSTDENSYGDLYQWGRNADGHQSRTSGTTTNLAQKFFTKNGIFIMASSSPYNWLSNVETNMWSGIDSENNPCPNGFRIPTAAEWEQERLTWVSNNAFGAFESLKLPMGGRRQQNNGELSSIGTIGLYWSSTISGSNSNGLVFVNNNAFIDRVGYRAIGVSIRCIKN